MLKLFQHKCNPVTGFRLVPWETAGELEHESNKQEPRMQAIQYALDSPNRYGTLKM